jgi:hypothetical protein
MSDLDPIDQSPYLFSACSSGIVLRPLAFL